MSDTLVSVVSGSRSLGMGHVMRSLRLVLYLEQEYGYTGYFSGRWDDGADAPFWRLHPLRLQRFSSAHPVPHDEIEWMIARASARLVIFDLLLEEERDAAFLAHLTGRGIRCVTLHEHVFPWADVALAVNPSVMEQGITAPPSRVSLQGPQVLLLDPAYGNPPTVERQPKTLAITLGGADPGGLTQRVVHEVLAATAFEGWRVVVVQGPAMATAEWGTDPRLEVLAAPGSLIRLFQEATLTITNGGTSCYEAIAAGTRVLAVAQNPFEQRVIDTLASQGALRAYNPTQLDDWQTVPQAGGLIDGRGIARVAEAIVHR